MAEAESARIARVLVDSPLPQLDRLFDYAIPASLAASVSAGIRVRVPLRSMGRIADAYVIEVLDRADAFAGALSEIEAVVSTAEVLAPEVWALARRVADRAAGGAGDVLRLAIPRRQVRVEKAWLAAREQLAAHEPDADPDAAASVPPAAPVPTSASVPAPASVPASASVPPQAESVAAEIQPVDPPGFDAARVAVAIDARARLAVSAVPRVVPLAADRGTEPTWVGHWTTTLAAAASRALEHGTVILCVPDYRDQDQLVAAVSRVVPADRIVQLDARQSGPDRYRAFLACRGDTPLVVIGNRSVIYAPAARLALIAIWDDGDPLHAEPLAPYVHARDAALVRQELQACGLWLVGHARSPEAQRLVELGFLDELVPSRATAPRVVPTAQQTAQDRQAAIARIPSSAWQQARAALEDGPVLVQVARPGYAPRLACTTCGESARCLHCRGPLGVRTARSAPACGWCGAIAVDWHCENCGGTAFRPVGQGAGRTAEELGRAFPGVRVIVADGEHRVTSVGPEPALVIATRGAEPIAASGYRAVLLLDGERMLARASLRVAEDCLRWWSNAASLAAPGAPVVLVGVGGPLASAMATWRLAGFAAAEVADRRRLRFPPAVRAATVTGDASAVDRALADVPELPGVDVLGPVELDDAVGGPGETARSAAPARPRSGARVVASGQVRAIVRFDYADGPQVTSALRAALVRNATSRRRRVAGATRAALPTLRVRCDDPALFDE